MGENEWLAARFEDHRAHLRGVAYRMLGSLSEADDAVQDAWLRFSRAGVDGVDNLGGWLTMIVARVCLNMLRSRNTRHEQSAGVHIPDPVISSEGVGLQPERKRWWRTLSASPCSSCSTPVAGGAARVRAP